MRIYLSVFGSGMGHASRMAALAEDVVARGGEVMFCSSGEVTKWLRSKGYGCNDVPLVDVVFTEAGSFSALDTLKLSPVLMARLCRQVQEETENLTRFGPAVVLSDSVASTVIASRILGIRSIAILNQLRLISSPRTPRLVASALAGASITIMNAFWELCDEILVPDLPPPYTISERNLWNAGSASSRARYIGFLTPRDAEGPGEARLLDDWSAERRRRRIFWQVSGPPATRGPFLAKALESAKALQDDCLFVITAGDPSGSTAPTRVPGGFLYGWCNETRAFVESCDAVVSRAGHVSISEYIMRGKPSLLVPIPAQTEQIGNAAKAQRLGIAIALDEKELEPGRLGRALGELMSESYAKRAAEIRRVAECYDAPRSIIDAIEKG